MVNPPVVRQCIAAPLASSVEIIIPAFVPSSAKPTCPFTLNKLASVHPDPTSTLPVVVKLTLSCPPKLNAIPP